MRIVQITSETTSNILAFTLYGFQKEKKNQQILITVKTFLYDLWVSFVSEINIYLTFSSVQFSRSVVSDSLRPHESQHARPPCPSPTPGVGDAIWPSHPLSSPSPSALNPSQLRIHMYRYRDRDSYLNMSKASSTVFFRIWGLCHFFFLCLHAL